MDDKIIPGIAGADIGKCAYGIFKKGKEYLGKTVGVSGENLSGSEMAEAFAKALGKKVVYNAVPPEVYRGFGFPGAEDLGNMFQYMLEFNDYFCKARDPKESRGLNPELQTFDQWLSANKERIPLE